jgi:hypothetical protein
MLYTPIKHKYVYMYCELPVEKQHHVLNQHSLSPVLHLSAISVAVFFPFLFSPLSQINFTCTAIPIAVYFPFLFSPLSQINLTCTGVEAIRVKVHEVRQLDRVGRLI